jgi:hypothetical protein
MDHEIHLSDTVDRVIHVPLTEAEWKAFLATTPQPIDWLRQRIKEAIENHAAPAARES